MAVDREVVREVTRTVVTIGVFLAYVTVVEFSRAWAVRRFGR